MGGAVAAQHEMQRLGVLGDLVGERLDAHRRGWVDSVECQHSRRHRDVVARRRVAVLRSCRIRYLRLYPALLGRAVLHGVVHGHVLAGPAPVQRDGEGDHVALESRRVVDGQLWRVDVVDGPVGGGAGAVEEGPLRVAQGDHERLIGVEHGVGQQSHRHGALGVAGAETERCRQGRTGPGLVIDVLGGLTGAGPAGDRIVHLHGFAVTGGHVEADGEVLGGVLGTGEAVNRQARRRVVFDGAHRVGLVGGVVGVAVEQFGVGARIAQHQMERLGALGQVVGHQLHRHLDLGVASSGEGERARQQVPRVRRRVRQRDRQRCPEIIDCSGRVGPEAADDVVVNGHVLGERRL